MDNHNNPMPVLLITGYLGSGKTTLLNRILTNTQGIRFAVVVNDLGEVNIDARLIRKGGIVGNGTDTDLVALQNGCICCTLKGDLMKQLDGLIDAGEFDYIVIEASGICEPAPIAQTIMAMRDMAQGTGRRYPRLDCICTVVDALRMRDEFASGDSLKRHDLDDEDIENLVIQQIEFCNMVLLNKISEVDSKDAGRLYQTVRALQPKAKIIECDYADVPLDMLLNTNLFDFEDVATSARWVRELEHLDSDKEHYHEHHDHDHEHHDHHEHDHGHEHHDHGPECTCGCHHHHHGEGEAEEYGISTFVYFNRKPFDLEKFDRFVATQWPAGVIRSKGVMYFSANPDMSLLFEQAGRQKNLTEAGYWFATAPAEELEQFMLTEPGLAEDWDDVYGDRMDKIVFIGRHMNREAITAALDSCLAD